ncbi:MAG: hypothetical protein IPM97_12525 [Bdellovibrionaceae bacterium]|nr:hypothetical protein [Pseudobdellovibrionaceae bacterium]
MLKMFFGTFVLLCCEFSYAAKVINWGPDFEATFSNSSSLTIDQKNELLNSFEMKSPYIFEKIIYRKNEGDWLGRKAKKRELFFAELENLKPKMATLFKNAEVLVAEKEAQFKKLFPDLANDIPVIFIPSIFSFNGKVVYLPDYGRTGLLMGVDLISYRNDNTDVLFSHEFFHAYHEDNLADGSTGATMATPLWKEGFATYVSGLLNPDQDDNVLLMDEALAKKCADQKFVKEIAKEYLVLLQTDGEKPIRIGL